jgi:hypothetical protein
MNEKMKYQIQGTVSSERDGHWYLTNYLFSGIVRAQYQTVRSID